MDNERLTAVLDSIPRGSWASYADVVLAAGGTMAQARALNQRLGRLGHKHAHRVLKGDGTIAATALGDPDAVRRKLKREGVRFEKGRAAAAARLRPGPASALSV